MLVKHAVFIEPEAVLRKFLLSSKEKINSIFPGQFYCNHPPHSTLYISVLEKPDMWLGAIEAVVQGISSFPAKIRNTIIFYDDELADGGHTLALRIEPSAQLSLLQRMVAETLATFVDKETIEPPSGFLNNEPFWSSYLKYGFAFVGKHWIPHFTVASLKACKSNPIIVEFQNLCPQYDFVVSQLSVWRIGEISHTRIAVFKLAE